MFVSTYQFYLNSFSLVLTPGLMEPGGSILHSQGLSNNSYPEPNQPNSPHWYLSLPRSILILSSPQRYLSCRFTCYNFESTLTFLHSGYMPCPSQSSRFNHPDYIRWTVQTMKILILESSALPILIPFRLKYSPQNSVFKYP